MVKFDRSKQYVSIKEYLYHQKDFNMNYDGIISQFQNEFPNN